MTTIKITDALARHDDFQLKEKINLEISGKSFAIIGPNGSGKTLLVDTILGNIPLREGSSDIYDDKGEIVPKIHTAFMSFRDIYRMSDTRGTYYQQRFHATENEETPFVRDILKIEKYPNAPKLIELLKIESLLDKRLLFLSSGELRKMLITKALLSGPKLLIVKNPFIGLDEESRKTINDLLYELSDRINIQIGLVVSNPDDIAPWIETVIPVKDKRVGVPVKYADFQRDNALEELFSFNKNQSFSLPDIELNDCNNMYENAIIMNNVAIAYSGKQILKDVNWTVKRGEKWALLGKNGCGKSTLLSLVCGDNPQGYANDITLFDRKRGTGESIWEIKSHIGYLTPDMHTYYQKNIPCIDIVASGFFDTIGLYKKPNDEQRGLALNWMKIFCCDNLAERNFMQISYGEQRLVLLTRVFVKQPSLVILDEPLHGLDVGKKFLAKKIIELYCNNPNVTLIYVTHYTNEIPEIVNQHFTLIKPQ